MSTYQLCSKRPAAPRKVEANPAVLGPVRASLMSQSRRRWVQGSKLTYSVQGGSKTERDVVRWAFDTWQPHVPGLIFEECGDWAKAVIRIALNRSGEAWSYVGTDVGKIPPSEQTMNLGWDLTDAWGHQTALHEISHTLGYEHEHQSPYAGIVWNVAEVLRVFGGPPNFWLPEVVFSQVLDKLLEVAVQGTLWDWKSVMMYPFEAGLIDKPEEFRTGLIPPLGLSANDIARALFDYPPPPDVVLPTEVTEAQPLTVQAAPGAAETEINFTTGAGTVHVHVKGAGDTLVVALDDEGKVLGADDDSGTQHNASMSIETGGGAVKLTIRPVWGPEGEAQPEVTVSVTE